MNRFELKKFKILGVLTSFIAVGCTPKMNGTPEKHSPEDVTAVVNRVKAQITDQSGAISANLAGAYAGVNSNFNAVTGLYNSLTGAGSPTPTATPPSTPTPTATPSATPPANCQAFPTYNASLTIPAGVNADQGLSTILINRLSIAPAVANGYVTQALTKATVGQAETEMKDTLYNAGFVDCDLYDTLGAFIAELNTRSGG